MDLAPRLSVRVSTVFVRAQKVTFSLKDENSRIFVKTRSLSPAVYFFSLSVSSSACPFLLPVFNSLFPVLCFSPILFVSLNSSFQSCVRDALCREYVGFMLLMSLHLRKDSGWCMMAKDAKWCMVGEGCQVRLVHVVGESLCCFARGC